MLTNLWILVLIVNLSLIQCRSMNNDLSVKDRFVQSVRLLRSPDENFNDNDDEDEDTEVVSHISIRTGVSNTRATCSPSDVFVQPASSKYCKLYLKLRFIALCSSYCGPQRHFFS